MFYGIFCAWAGGVRVAGAVGTDAYPHPIERHERRAGHQSVGSTTLAAIFLPFVSKHGYSSIFLSLAALRVYLLVVALFFAGDQRQDAGGD